MLDCRKCGFLVTKDMSFSVRQNKCPSCGSVLMDNSFLSDVKDVKLKISSSRILSKSNVSEDVINMLSIFIKNNFMVSKDIVAETLDDVLEVAEEVQEEADIEIAEETMEDIREKIRNDALASAEGPEVFESEIERKKALARNNPFARKTGARVSRVSGD